ncbi:24654_t:CDS:1, partial [Gigaspora rosea]
FHSTFPSLEQYFLILSHIPNYQKKYISKRKKIRKVQKNPPKYLFFWIKSPYPSLFHTSRLISIVENK